ncbi:MAG: hypothetical protein MUE82_00740 [Chloroflexi bacterium]|jgi:hypothetical protein|nr:hypothetical protein [Chloroflexota bacterium]
MARRLAALAAVGFVAALLVMAVPPAGPARAAGGYLYNARMTSGIARIAADGSGFTDGFVAPGGSALDVAADAAHLYWMDQVGARIGRSDLDGTGVDPSFITIGADGTGLAVDASHIYWMHSSGGVWAIGRANLDGTGVTPVFIAGSASMTNGGVAVDGTHLYWTNFASGTGSTIGRANLDGTGADPAWLSGLTAPCRVVAAGGFVYWSSWATIGAIGRASTADPVASTLVPALSRPWGLAVDAQHVYWTVGNTASIGRSGIDGSDATSSWVTGLVGFGRGLATDGTGAPPEPTPSPSPTPTASPTTSPTPSPSPSPSPSPAAATPSPTPGPTLVPTVTSFSPRAGVHGSLVTIFGTNLGYVRSVTFGGVPATFSVRSPTTIVARVPAGATTGPIGVTSPFGSAVGPGSFIVLH